MPPSHRRGTAFLTVLLFRLVFIAHAHSEYRSLIPSGFNVPKSPGVGHRYLPGGHRPNKPRTRGNLLNPFGRDFVKAKFEWTLELCRADSDGDGESNGLELGDPCCEWREGMKEPRRPWRISHPGVSPDALAASKPIDDFVATTGLPMPNCSAVASEDARLPAAKEETIFWDFYYSTCNALKDCRVPANTATSLFLEFLAEVVHLPLRVARRGIVSGGSGLIHGGQDVATLCFVLECALLWHWSRPKLKSAAAAGTAGGDGSAICGGRRLASCIRCSRLRRRKRRKRLAAGVSGAMPQPQSQPWKGRRQKLLVALAAVAFVDVFSGLLHLVLDNPAFNTYPIIGPAASSFQNHHHDPGGITRGPFWVFVREHHVAVAAGVGTAFLYPASAPGAGTLRGFVVLAGCLSSLMMAAHRWSHTAPTRLPVAVRWMQRLGLLIAQRHHSAHHLSYTVNFAIFTGWCNPVLNLVTAHLVPPTSLIWLPALVLWTLVPLACAWVLLIFFSRDEDWRDHCCCAGGAGAGAAAARRRRRRGRQHGRDLEKAKAKAKAEGMGTMGGEEIAKLGALSFAKHLSRRWLYLPGAAVWPTSTSSPAAHAAPAAGTSSSRRGKFRATPA